jgi:hypothetical protein
MGDVPNDMADHIAPTRPTGPRLQWNRTEYFLARLWGLVRLLTDLPWNGITRRITNAGGR